MRERLPARIARYINLSKVSPTQLKGDCFFPGCDVPGSMQVTPEKWWCATCGRGGDEKKFDLLYQEGKLSQALRDASNPALLIIENAARVLPHDIQAEMAALGSAILSKTAARIVLSKLIPSDFYRPAHAVVFRALDSLVAADTDIDLVTLVRQLTVDGKLSEAGGEDYIIQVAEYVPSAANADHYTQIVIDCAQLRMIGELGKYAMTAIHGGVALGDSPDDIIAELSAKLRRARMRGTSDLENAANVKPAEVDWLIPGLVARGKLLSVEGDPSVGKTATIEALAAAISVGATIPSLSDNPLPKCRTLLLACEDDTADTTVPRLISMGADLTMIDIVDEDWPLNDRGLAKLRDMVMDGHYGLVMMDTLTSFMSQAVTERGLPLPNSHILSMLRMIATDSSAAFMMTRHMRKSGDTNPLYAGLGDIGIIGKCRLGIQCHRDPDDPEWCVLVNHKNNLAPQAKSVRYQIRPIANNRMEFFWGDRSELTAYQVAEKWAERKLAKAGRKQRTSDEANQEWIAAQLETATYKLDTLKGRAKDLGMGNAAFWKALRSMSEVVTAKSKDGEAWAGLSGCLWPWEANEEYDPFADTP